MAFYNKVILLGNLTRDIELRYSPKGTTIGKGSLAINRRWKSDDGEDREEVCFVEFDAFGRTAEVLAQYTNKGSSILIEGRLRLSQWEDKTSGDKRQKLSVVVETFQFAGSKQEQGERPKSQRGQAAAESAQADAPADDSDVPF